jgi:transposase
MRFSFDGLYGLVQNRMGQDPLSGHLFAFINRRATHIKVLYFDRTGLCVWANQPSSYCTSSSSMRGR